MSPLSDAAPQPPGVACDGRAHQASAAAPDASAFEAVYRAHFRFVWRCARRMGVPDASLDDVVQDAFVVVHRRLAEFGGRSSIKTWLYGIVRRVVADHRRTRRRKPGHDATAAAGDPCSPADPSPEGGPARSEQRLLLRRVLAELDDEKREVLLLADLEGMTMAEIGEAIDANANTVSSRLRAARREFEQALARLSADPREPHGRQREASEETAR